MVVEIFLELFSRDQKKLPTEKKELIDFAIASLLKKSKQQLTTMYDSREEPSYSILHPESQMFLAHMKDIPASEMIDALQNLPHLEQVVYALAAIDGYTSQQIAKMIGGEEPKVDALITGARRHILENLLKPQIHNSVRSCSVFEE
jgi:DNA-directed RNA polymerase specialized sigma24 family protein